MSNQSDEQLDDLRLFVLGLLNEITLELAKDCSGTWNVEYIDNNIG